jgi:hypothetical protein
MLLGPGMYRGFSPASSSLAAAGFPTTLTSPTGATDLQLRAQSSKTVPTLDASCLATLSQQFLPTAHKTSFSGPITELQENFPYILPLSRKNTSEDQPDGREA